MALEDVKSRILSKPKILTNIADIDECINGDDELVIRKTHKDGSKCEYTITMRQLLNFITDSIVTSEGDDLETHEYHQASILAECGL